jgi:hypothetical protein
MPYPNARIDGDARRECFIREHDTLLSQHLKGMASFQQSLVKLSSLMTGQTRIRVTQILHLRRRIRPWDAHAAEERENGLEQMAEGVDA